MCARPAPKKTTHHTSGRKHPKVDYLQYDTSEDPPSPPRKRRTVDLKRCLSAGRIAAEMYKTKPLNLSRPVRKGHMATTPVTTSTIVQPSIVSTSSNMGTIMKPVSQKETDDVINQLLNIDVPLDNEQQDDYDVPLVPTKDKTQPQPHLLLPPVAPSRGDVSDKKPVLLPGVLDKAVKIEDPTPDAKLPPKKKEFKTVEYKLKRKYTKSRNFICVQCSEKCASQKELNEHFRAKHPSVKCALFQKYFNTRVAMLHRKYKHYEYMYECKICDKGFQFESQQREHMREHQSQGDWVCFKPKCGKCFKRESKLNAHLFAHNTVPQKCKHCPYMNLDPRNLHAHTHKHSDVLPFKCGKCGKGFKFAFS